MRRPEPFDGRALLLARVDGHDLGRPGDARALNRRDADSAAADHSHARSGHHACGVEHRADAGGHAAADQCGDVEGHVIGDRDGALPRHDKLLGEGTGAAHPIGALVANGEVRGECRRAEQFDAEVGLARQTRRAVATGRDPAHDDAPAHPQPLRHVGADLGEHTGALVPQHERLFVRQDPGHRRQVRVADAGGLDPDPHVAGAEGPSAHVVPDLGAFLPRLPHHRSSHARHSNGVSRTRNRSPCHAADGERFASDGL